MKIYNFLLLCVLSLSFASCHKDSPKDCDFCGKISGTLNDIKGTLSISTVGNNKIWIVERYSAGPYVFKTCNVDAIKDLEKPDARVPVVFSGDFYKAISKGTQPKDATLRGSITIHSIKKDTSDDTLGDFDR